MGGGGGGRGGGGEVEALISAFKTVDHQTEYER